ncbi:MAG: hypothetical protein Q9166_001015 [cf. Caloplaca sp. 2 TL-2023]
MSCSTSDCLDSLTQMAPHIIILEPVETHPHQNLYQKMILNERQILEQSRKRHCHFPQVVARRARQLHACLTRHFDPEEDEAIKLLELAKKHKLAENYRANASSINLSKRMRACSCPSDDEPESCEIITVHSQDYVQQPYGDYPQQQGFAPKDVHKNGITITVSPSPPLSPSPTHYSNLPSTDNDPSMPLPVTIFHRLIVRTFILNLAILQSINDLHSLIHLDHFDDQPEHDNYHNETIPQIILEQWNGRV